MAGARRHANPRCVAFTERYNPPARRAADRAASAEPRTVTLTTYKRMGDYCYDGPYMQLESATGALLAWSGDANGYACSSITYTLPANTTYRLFLRYSFTVAMPGSYELDISFP